MHSAVVLFRNSMPASLFANNVLTLILIALRTFCASLPRNTESPIAQPEAYGIECAFDSLPLPAHRSMKTAAEAKAPQLFPGLRAMLLMAL